MYIDKFRKKDGDFTETSGEMAIDGYLILELTEEDLEAEMGVTIKLHRKKLIKGRLDFLRGFPVWNSAVS